MTNNNDESEQPTPLLVGKLYDRVKFTTQVVLPATSTLYFTLGAVWGLPYVEQVIGTLAAIATFLGVILGFSSKAYYASDARFDGSAVIMRTDEGKKIVSLELNGDPAQLIEQEEIRFKVTPPE